MSGQLKTSIDELIDKSINSNSRLQELETLMNEIEKSLQDFNNIKHHVTQLSAEVLRLNAFIRQKFPCEYDRFDQ
jgi:predicted ester cyclase